MSRREGAVTRRDTGPTGGPTNGPSTGPPTEAPVVVTTQTSLPNTTNPSTTPGIFTTLQDRSKVGLGDFLEELRTGWGCQLCGHSVKGFFLLVLAAILSFALVNTLLKVYNSFFTEN